MSTVDDDDAHAVLGKLDGFFHDNGLSEFSKKMAHQWVLKALRGELPDTRHVTKWLLDTLNHRRIW